MGAGAFPVGGKRLQIQSSGAFGFMASWMVIFGGAVRLRRDACVYVPSHFKACGQVR